MQRRPARGETDGPADDVRQDDHRDGASVGSLDAMERTHAELAFEAGRLDLAGSLDTLRHLPLPLT